MSATGANADAQRGQGERLGFASGQVVLEIGYDNDCDEELRTAIESTIGTGMVDEDFQDVADVVVLWWREDDGDLVDALVDSISSIAAGGVVWLLTPKAGRPGHVEPSDIGEASPTAGLSATKSTSAAKDWSGTRLVAPRIAR